MQRRWVALEYEPDDADGADDEPIDPGSLEAAVLAAAIANYEAMFPLREAGPAVTTGEDRSCRVPAGAVWPGFGPGRSLRHAGEPATPVVRADGSAPDGGGRAG